MDSIEIQVIDSGIECDTQNVLDLVLFHNKDFSVDTVMNLYLVNLRYNEYFDFEITTDSINIVDKVKYLIDREIHMMSSTIYDLHNNSTTHHMNLCIYKTIESMMNEIEYSSFDKDELKSTNLNIPTEYRDIYDILLYDSDTSLEFAEMLGDYRNDLLQYIDPIPRYNKIFRAFFISDLIIKMIEIRISNLKTKNLNISISDEYSQSQTLESDKSAGNISISPTNEISSLHLICDKLYLIIDDLYSHLILYIVYPDNWWNMSRSLSDIKSKYDSIKLFS